MQNGVIIPSRACASWQQCLLFSGAAGQQDVLHIGADRLLSTPCLQCAVLWEPSYKQPQCKAARCSSLQESPCCCQRVYGGWAPALTQCLLLFVLSPPCPAACPHLPPSLPPYLLPSLLPSLTASFPPIQVDEVKGIMMQNVEQVLVRGERLDVLVDRTDDLRDQVRLQHCA